MTPQDRDVVDLFDLLKWIDENPLTQFREMTPLENGAVL